MNFVHQKFKVNLSEDNISKIPLVIEVWNLTICDRTLWLSYLCLLAFSLYCSPAHCCRRTEYRRFACTNAYVQNSLQISERESSAQLSYQSNFNGPNAGLTQRNRKLGDMTLTIYQAAIRMQLKKIFTSILLHSSENVNGMLSCNNTSWIVSLPYLGKFNAIAFQLYIKIQFVPRCKHLPYLGQCNAVAFELWLPCFKLLICIVHKYSPYRAVNTSHLR
jgi:hypothetical protein